MHGNYAKFLFEERLSKCDTVFFLDYSVNTCLNGVRQRRGKPRPDMPWIEEKEDQEFMDYIRQFPDKQKTEIIKMLVQHPNLRIYHFKHRQETADFLNKLN